MKKLIASILFLLVSAPAFAALPLQTLELAYSTSSGQLYAKTSSVLSVFVVQGMTESAADYLENLKAGLTDAQRVSCQVQGVFVRSSNPTLNVFAVSCEH